MYSNMKYYENICNCLRVIQQDINRKLKSANCWQQTSLKEYTKIELISFESFEILMLKKMDRLKLISDI